MKRRDFLWNTLRYSVAGLVAPTLLPRGAHSDPRDGVRLTGPPKRIGTNHPLAGRVLVIIDLKGGNDGVNTVVPYTDPNYPILRPSIAVPPGAVHPLSTTAGLHPALGPLYDLYNNGKLAVIQGVGYPEMNLSHFRATDIWLSGSSRDVYLETGWIARFLEMMFPEFPTHTPDQPYGIQQSFNHRLPLQGDRSQVGVVVDNPESFYSLVLGAYSGTWEDPLPDTRGGEELGYVRGIDRETFEYAEAIETAAEAGENSVEYPDSSLGRQLRSIALLISGQLGTPIYLGKRGGFDTHSDQLERHDQILDDLAQSVSAFVTDLANQGLDEKVLVMTISEFGRRVEENGSFGTDHGTAAPMFLVGTPVNGGLYGDLPSLTDLDEHGNLLVQQDYRGICGQVLRSHFGAPEEVVNEVFMGEFTAPEFLQENTTSAPEGGAPLTYRLYSPFPNPISGTRAAAQVGVDFDLAHATPVTVELFDAQGRRVRELSRGLMAMGRHRVNWTLGPVPAGTYLLRLRTTDWEKGTKLVVLP